MLHAVMNETTSQYDMIYRERESRTTSKKHDSQIYPAWEEIDRRGKCTSVKDEVSTVIVRGAS